MKGVEASVTNSTLIGSLSLLAAITNRGDWYISNLLSRNNSDNFISYIGKLLNWIQNDLCIEAFRIVFDNGLIAESIHQRKPSNS